MTMNFDAMAMEDIWNEIKVKLNEEPEPLLGLTTTYSFNLSGENGGMFGLNIADGKADIVIGDPGEVDCALSMSVKDFKKLLGGNLNSTASYMMGKLKVKGSLGLALTLEGLLKKYSL